MKAPSQTTQLAVFFVKKPSPKFGEGGIRLPLAYFLCNFCAK